MAGNLPEGVLEAARRGRLVVLAGEPIPEAAALPAAMWIAAGPGWIPGASERVSVADIEEGAVKRLPAGAVIEGAGREAWGSARRPTRFREWFERLQRGRTVLLVGPAPEGMPRCERCVRGGLEELEVLRERTSGVKALDPPALPGVSSRAGLAGLGLAAAAGAGAWLAVYERFRGSQNWPWISLIPWAAGVLMALAALGPLAGRAAAAVDLDAREWYARVLARWSRWPRAPAAAALWIVLALGAWWLLRRNACATFVILYEPGVVSVEGSAPLGACQAEVPCTFAVPRPSRLHFDGAEGGECGLDFTAGGAVLFIDTEQDDCQPFVPEEQAPSPRG